MCFILKDRQRKIQRQKRITFEFPAQCIQVHSRHRFFNKPYGVLTHHLMDKEKSIQQVLRL